MKQTKHLFPSFICTLIAVFLALAIGGGLFMALRSDFTADIGHFTVGSPWFYVFAVSAAVAAVLAAVVGLLTPKKEPMFQDAPDFLSQIIAVCVAAAAFVLFIFNLRNELQANDFAISALGEAVSVAGIALFFVLRALRPKNSKTLTEICGIVSVLSVILTMFNNYFDTALPLNSPIRNVQILTESAVLLYLLTETRMVFGKSAPRFCRFASHITVSLAGGFSLGLLLALMLTDQAPPVIFAPRCVMCFAIAVHAALRCMDRPQSSLPADQ